MRVGALILFAVLFCGCNAGNNNNVNKTIPVPDIYTLGYNSKLLESSPFYVVFTENIDRPNKYGRPNDSLYFINGRSGLKGIDATIRYDPRDNQVYDVIFIIKNLPLNPSISDVQSLIDFSNKYDSSFASYFKRNFEGLFIDEDKFTDTTAYSNTLCNWKIAFDGDVALNNMDLKKHPDERQRIIDAGNYASIIACNTKK